VGGWKREEVLRILIIGGGKKRRPAPPMATVKAILACFQNMRLGYYGYEKADGDHHCCYAMIDLMWLTTDLQKPVMYAYSCNEQL
jgi:hypothetical protein